MLGTASYFSFKNVNDIRLSHFVNSTLKYIRVFVVIKIRHFLPVVRLLLLQQRVISSFDDKPNRNKIRVEFRNYTKLLFIGVRFMPCLLKNTRFLNAVKLLKTGQITKFVRNLTSIDLAKLKEPIPNSRSSLNVLDKRILRVQCA